LEHKPQNPNIIRKKSEIFATRTESRIRQCEIKYHRATSTEGRSKAEKRKTASLNRHIDKKASLSSSEENKI
jgi:hypothetical protein